MVLRHTRGVFLHLILIPNGAILGEIQPERIPAHQKNTGDYLMCLAMPMQIVTVGGTAARARAQGIERDVSLFLLQDQKITGRNVVPVHVGYAIRKIDRNEADRSWGLYEEMQALGADSAHA